MSSEANRIELGPPPHDSRDGSVPIKDEILKRQTLNAAAPLTTSARGNNPPLEVEQSPSGIPELSTGSQRPKTGKRLRLLAAASALLLTTLTLAAVYLVTRKPSTIDQLVILTVPSGAEIKLNSRDYGHSPVKLEQLTIGTYTLTITKEGFEPVEETITVTESGPLEYKLKPVAPSDVANLPMEEQIRRYQQSAEEAFARGYYGVAYEGSALNYADLILYWDANNSFAKEMRERIRKASHQLAQTSIARGDLAQAQDIYNFLIIRYEYDEEARVGAAKLESQLAARRGKVGELIRKAEEAFQAGRLAEPLGSSAYYYSKQALAIERENSKAREIRNQVKEALRSAGDQAIARGDTDGAVKQFEQAAQLFPEDKQLRVRARDLQAARTAELAKANDPNTHRLRGLEEARKENFADAIPDLLYAAFNGRGTPDVLYALARSYFRIGQLDQAEQYFLKLQPADGEPYRSSISALGDIAMARGDSSRAVERWKEARQLGGSTLYSVANLDDKIERVERKQREKAAEPQPLTIQARHVHGGLLGGSCSGGLSVSSTGVIYEGKEHQYSYNVASVGVRIAKDELTLQLGKDSLKLKVTRTDAERFRETLNRYQTR